jgi:DNA polymerase III delta prime subunit
MMTMTRSTLATLLLALALPASAQTIYRCTDANGGMLISNTRVDKSCKAVVLPPDSSLPAPRSKPSGAAANPSPAGFPRVPEDAQKARDTDRKRILEQELAGEQRSLDQAQRELADQDSLRGRDGSASALDRVQPYRDRVAQHERNIVAIQKELSGLR